MTYSVNFKCSILWSKYLILEVIFLFLFSYQKSISFQKTHQFHTTGPIIHGDKCTWIHLQGLCTCLHFYMGNLHIRWFLRKIIIYWKGSHLNKKKYIDTVTYIPVSHSVPVNPFTQVHVNELIPSRQCPPFSQGELAHSLISCRSLQKFISHNWSSDNNAIISWLVFY